MSWCRKAQALEEQAEQEEMLRKQLQDINDACIATQQHVEQIEAERDSLRAQLQDSPASAASAVP